MADLRNRRMDDPGGLVSRVFVGNIPLDADRETIKAKFEVHGAVIGVMVLKGFAFVQFEKDLDAKKAIEMEHGKEFLGKKIDVKPAKQNTPIITRASEKAPDELGVGDMDVEVEEDMNNPWGPPPWGIGGRGRGGRGTVRGTQVSQMVSRGRGDFNRGGFNRGGAWNGGGGYGGGFGRGGGGYPHQPGHGYQEEDGYQEEGGGQGYDQDAGEEYNEMSDMEKFNERLNSDIYGDEEGMSNQGVGRGGSWGDRGGWRGARGGGGLPRGAGETVFLFGPGVMTEGFVLPVFMCQLLFN